MIEQEGRPEVCFNGIWGSICRTSFSAIDSFVFCKTLGYDGPSNVICQYIVNTIYYYLSILDPTVYTYNSPFGSGNAPIVWNYVNCRGWEQDIHECTKSIYPGFTCYSSYPVGIGCKESKLHIYYNDRYTPTHPSVLSSVDIIHNYIRNYI